MVSLRKALDFNNYMSLSLTAGAVLGSSISSWGVILGGCDLYMCVCLWNSVQLFKIPLPGNSLSQTLTMMLETQRRIRQIDDHGVSRADMKHRGHGSWERPRQGFLEGAVSCRAAFLHIWYWILFIILALSTLLGLGLKVPLSLIPRNNSEIFVDDSLKHFSPVTLGKKSWVLGEVTAGLCVFSAFWEELWCELSHRRR